MAISSNSFIVADSHITVCFVDGYQATVYKSDQNFDLVREAVRSADWEQARVLFTPVEVIRKAVSGVGGVRIDNGVVMFNEQAIHTTLTTRMLSMLSDGFDVTPMMLFLDNLMSNPSFRAVTELYDFLEASHLPITEDGHFLAYKRIKEDYTDCHTGTMDNSIGAVVVMDRNQVDEDKDRTCSAGLHFCSREYLPQFPGARTVVLKINPADVVAIPSDYRNSKGRACRYEVIQELENEAPAELEGSFDTNSSIARILKMDCTGVVIARYTSIEEAAHDSRIKREYIARVLRGDRATTGGFGWAYEMRKASQEEDGVDYYSVDFDDDEDGFYSF